VYSFGAVLYSFKIELH